MHFITSIATIGFALLGCSETHITLTELGAIQSQCSKMVDVGSKSICLPIITAMSECSNNKQVMDLPGARVSDACTVHGIYLSEAQAADLTSLDGVVLNDYFKVYVVDETANQDFTKGAIASLVEGVSKGVFRRNWSDITSGLDSIFDGVRFGQPVLMESYRPSDHIASMVYLTPIHMSADFESYGLMTMSICAVNNRLFWVTHYLEYNGPQSVKQAKSKSDYFTLRLVEANH